MHVTLLTIKYEHCYIFLKTRTANSTHRVTDIQTSTTSLSHSLLTIFIRAILRATQRTAVMIFTNIPRSPASHADGLLNASAADASRASPLSPCDIDNPYYPPDPALAFHPLCDATCRAFGACGVELMVHVAQRLFPADSPQLHSIEVNSTLADPSELSVAGVSAGAQSQSDTAAADVNIDACTPSTRVPVAAAAHAKALIPIEVASTTSSDPLSQEEQEVSACAARVIHVRARCSPVFLHQPEQRTPARVQLSLTCVCAGGARRRQAQERESFCASQSRRVLCIASCTCEQRVQ